MNKKYEKTIKKHNNYKLNRELKELQKLEKDIEKNMNELHEEIEEELFELNNKTGEWDYIELNKYNRLKKTQKNIKEKIKESKNKELKIILAFLVHNGLKTEEEILELIGEEKEEKNMNKKKIEELLEYPWSGLNIYERHKKNTDNLQIKVKEAVNIATIADNATVKMATKNVKKEVEKAGRAAFTLADTENTHMNYEVTKEIIEMVEVERVRLLYNAILDERTCWECEAMDGKIFKVGEEPKIPQHPDCRCSYTPITDTVWIMKEHTTAIIDNMPM